MTRVIEESDRRRGVQQYGTIGLEFRPMPTGKTARANSVDSVTQKLKAEPNRFALVEEGAHSRGCATKWRNRGCETRTFASEVDPKLYDVYARWPEGE